MSEQPDRPTPLEPLDEEWQRALCVVAHPDDLEFGAAAAVARWTGQGKHVVYCMVTSGEAGIDGMHPDECRTVREAEQVESARHRRRRPGRLPRAPRRGPRVRRPAAREIARVVRRHRPDIVITGNFRDTWGGSQPQPGRPHRRRQGRPRRRARRRQPLGLRRPARPTASSRGAGSGRSGRPGPRTRARGRHDRHVRGRRRLAGGTPRPTSTASAGSTSIPASSSRGSPADRSAARRGVRGAVRGLPDGLGRVAALPGQGAHCGQGFTTNEPVRRAAFPRLSVAVTVSWSVPTPMVPMLAK